jgi:hypothetical protein
MLSDKLFNVACWVAMPLVMITMEKSKAARVMGFLFTLTVGLPLFFVGMALWVLAFLFFAYEEI